MAIYIPKQGDIIATTFDPQAGHEQKTSACSVVSKDCSTVAGLGYSNAHNNAERGFPFHVPVPEDSSLTGFIMVEQVNR